MHLAPAHPCQLPIWESYTPNMQISCISEGGECFLQLLKGYWTDLLVTVYVVHYPTQCHLKNFG
jgi:hypothetical protein